MNELSPKAIAVAERTAGRYAAVSLIEAVALGGSWSSGDADKHSDIDLYVYSRSTLPLGLRSVVASANASRTEVNNQFWEPGDEWIDAESGFHIDAIFRTQRWIEDQLEKILDRHVASLGCSTCFWHNVLNSRILFDRSGWYSTLQQKARQPYPWQLKGAIISKNYPVLRDSLSSYRHQLEGAIRQCDDIAIHQRAAAFTASVIDILFAINEVPHPGEKRLLAVLETRCKKLPDRFHEDLKAFYRAASVNHLSLLSILDHLVTRLEALLQREGLL